MNTCSGDPYHLHKVMQDAADAMGWSVEWTIAHFMYGAWRADGQMSMVDDGV